MRQNTELFSQGLRSAMDFEFKTSLHITWAVDPTLTTTSSPSAPRSPIAHQPDAEESYSGDETVVIVDSVGEHLITEMFPGATEIS